MKFFKFAFVVLFACSTGLYAQESDALKESANAIFNYGVEQVTTAIDTTTKLMHAGLVAQQERQSTNGLVPAVVALAKETTELGAVQMEDVAAKSIVIGKDVVETTVAVAKVVGKKIHKKIDPLIDPFIQEVQDEKNTSLATTNSQSLSDRTQVVIDATSKKVDEVSVGVKKTMTSMCDYVIANSGRIVGITAAIATIIGVTWYVYTQSCTYKDAQIEHN